ncbi:MAG: gluconokinase [Terriglobia bacterium]|jgi:gluconokinase|nr:gluconokinase [Terriglobia bacterium]
MIVILMGVAGVGKTTVGRLLATQLGWEFADADAYHSPQNIEKMAAGIPLSDADRRPWLGTLRQAIESWVANNKNVVLACSALKQSYRDLLAVSASVKFVYLSGTFALIDKRLRQRAGHYMHNDMLESQLAALEEPASTPTVDVSATPDAIVREIRHQLKL